MKNKGLLLGLAAVFMTGMVVIITLTGTGEQRKYQPRKTVYERGIQGAIEWLGSIRNNRTTGTISIEEVVNARKQIAELSNNKAMNITWSELGPNNVGGRVRAILIDKDNHNLIYAGAVSGGLWKSETGGSSWVCVSSFPDLNISCVAQNPITGALYVGTGEDLGANVGHPYGTPGFLGTGLYESTDGGNTWAIYNGATPASYGITNDTWSFVRKIAFDPTTGRLFAATKRGLRYWDGSTWVNPIYLTGTTLNTGSCNTVRIGSDRTVIAVVGNKVYVSTGLGELGTFSDMSPAIGLGRTEIAIAPSDPNTVYACAASGSGGLKGIYKSTDKCGTWSLLGSGAPAFNLFGDNSQGSYDNEISVSPSDPNFVLAGGICIWKYTGGNFTQITTGFEEIDVHADIHAIIFDNTNPNIIYVGCDGGVFKSISYSSDWQAINKNLNVTQMYSVANSKTGEVMSGTQDNSTPYVSRTGSDPKNAAVLFGGDGGWSAFSAINPSIFFGTMQYGGTWRSPDKGVTYQSANDNQFFSTTMIGSYVPGSDPAFAAFVTPMFHWESFSDYYSLDSVYFKAVDTSYTAGQSVVVRSSNANFPFNYVLPVSIADGDSLAVQDIISSKYFVALSSGIWMTKQALNFAATPEWIKISSVNAACLTVSDDGNYLFAGTQSGALYRISNILAVKDSLNGTITSTSGVANPYCVIEQKMIESWSGRSLTGIGIDPNDPSRVVVTLGNYGQTSYIYFSSNALDFDPSFTSKQGTATGKKLPAMPLYSCLIEMTDGKRVLVGSEYGIFATEDITKTASTIEWTEENIGAARVPVFGIRQQTKQVPGIGNTWGAVYIGTHGRGFFETNMFVTAIPETDDRPTLQKPGLNVYPNPIVNTANIEYSLPLAAKVIINIYDLNGRLVKSINMGDKGVGMQYTTLDLSSVGRGTYIMQLVAGKETASSKIVITK